jgi:hypothetical protein
MRDIRFSQQSLWNITVLWGVMPCNLVVKCSRFTGVCCLHLQDLHYYHTTQHLPDRQQMSRGTGPYTQCYEYVYTKKQSHVLLLSRLLSRLITQLENGCLCIHPIHPNISRVWIYYCILKKIKHMWCETKNMWNWEHDVLSAVNVNTTAFWDVKQELNFMVLHPRRLIFMHNHNTQY